MSKGRSRRNDQSFSKTNAGHAWHCRLLLGANIFDLILPIPSATMSAALKDDIKSAMSGVGVTLSGDMLSKCEFLCVWSSSFSFSSALNWRNQHRPSPANLDP